MTVSRKNEVNDIERIKVLHNPEIIKATYLRVINNVKGKWSHFADIHSFSQSPLIFDKLMEVMLGAKVSHQIKFRFITEITKDNLQFCKEVAETVEVRHLEGIKGNFGISEGEYISISTIESQPESEPESPVITKTTSPCAVYSNVEEDIQQHQYIFEILWNRAIPAKQRIKEIEEGAIHYQTRIIDDSHEISRALYRLFATSNKLDICLTAGGMQCSSNHSFEVKKKLWQKQEDGKDNGVNTLLTLIKTK